MVPTPSGPPPSRGRPAESAFFYPQPSRPHAQTARHSQATGLSSPLPQPWSARRSLGGRQPDAPRSSSPRPPTPSPIQPERGPAPPARPPPRPSPRPSQLPSSPGTSSHTGPGFLFSACMHYSPVAPFNLEPVIYPASVQTTYPCLCHPCDFALRLSEGASIRQLWFDIAVPRYDYLIELGESTVRSQAAYGGSKEDGATQQGRRGNRWLEPVLEDARRIKEDQGKEVAAFIAGMMRDFGRRWGVAEGERLMRALRGVRGSDA